MTDFTFHTIENSDGETKATLENIQKAYGFVPNLFGYMAEAPITIDAYMMLNEIVLTKTSFTTGQIQVGLLTASMLNECDFCTTAHRAMAVKFGSNPASIKSLVEGTTIEDKEDKAIADMVTSIIKHRGWVPEEDMTAFFAVGFTKKHFLELQLVVTIKTLSNYINHMTKPEANAELVAMAGE